MRRRALALALLAVGSARWPAWPTAVLVDRQGIVRYHRAGEGAYEEVEAVIRRLLAERG